MKHIRGKSKYNSKKITNLTNVNDRAVGPNLVKKNKTKKTKNKQNKQRI